MHVIFIDYDYLGLEISFCKSTYMLKILLKLYFNGLPFPPMTALINIYEQDMEYYIDLIK